MEDGSREEKIGERTVGAAELSNSIDESLVELGGPAEAGLGVRSEDQARITGQIGAVERALEVGVGNTSVEGKGMNCRVHLAEQMRRRRGKSGEVGKLSGLGSPEKRWREEERNGWFQMR